MDSRFNRPRIVNFRWNIEGKITSYLHFLSVSDFWRFWYFISSRICKGCALLETHKERILAFLFFVLEVVSVVLDQIGKNKVDFLLAALLLSVFGFAITLYSFIEARTDTTIKAETQMMVVEIVFSLIQLIVTFIQYLLTVLKVKNDYNASAFPLAFAIIAVVFVFIKDGKIPDESLPRVNPQPIGSMASIPALEEIVCLTNQVRPESSKNHVKLRSSKHHDKPESSTNQVKAESSTVRTSTHALYKKLVMKFEINDDKAKEKAMDTVFDDISEFDSFSMDMKNNIWTVIGNIVDEDVIKLGQICKTERVSVEPAKKPEEKEEKRQVEPKKVVMKLEINDDEAKKKVMATVAGTSGVDSVSISMENKELTVEGNIFAEDVVLELRKMCKTDIVSVKPAKEREKKKEGKRDEVVSGKKKEENKDEVPMYYKLYDIPYKPYDIPYDIPYKPYDIPYKNPYYHIKSE